MKRIHLHVSVPDLGASIQFYETLFGAAPVVVKDDYAKWMLDDPKVNFAISERARAAGIDHIGIQVDSADELGRARRSPQGRRGGDVRSGSDHLLLRAVGQELGPRSRRRALGDLLHLR